MDSETKIRRDINAIMNLQRNDFETLREYNDFLEKKEDLIYQRVQKIDEEKIKEYLDNFQRKNYDKIILNRQQLESKLQKEKENFKREQLRRMNSIKQFRQKENERLMQKKRMETEEVEKFVLGDKAASNRSSERSKKKAKTEKSEQSLKLGINNNGANSVKRQVSSYASQVYAMFPPLQLNINPQKVQQVYMNTNASAKADIPSGFTKKLIAQRGKQEFFQSLFFD
ncbi:cdk-activating kinase assembly factor mat1 [Anaeramoeba flamelloides]|uniref:Cdk-activating kinase assembly factor mat1 n=1 Tax=Anaeramoeba flamelloides TaxID=1746091 RepID=A0AAV7Z3H2_9EUKA|nr:cdk-activating kinase assembly factor mat1 [Anaeramoeba flamelloides]KAJ6225981.1 cdk-activating kinase assembly factor mat1 [Anaeramoeba flamelloides]